MCIYFHVTSSYSYVLQYLWSGKLSIPSNHDAQKVIPNIMLFTKYFIDHNINFYISNNKVSIKVTSARHTQSQWYEATVCNLFMAISILYNEIYRVLTSCMKPCSYQSAYKILHSSIILVV